MKTQLKYLLIAPLFFLICGSSVTLAQSVVNFYLTQFSGTTNDTTINVRAQNNPIIYNGNFYWWPQNGTNFTTTNGFAAMTLVPSKYIVSVAGVPQSWTITVTNSATALNAIGLTTSTVIYNGINSLSGPVVSNDGHGNYTVNGSGAVTNTDHTVRTTTTNGITQVSVSTPIVMTNNYVATLEQFGGHADGQKLYVTATTSSPIISATNANWSTADVGKCCQLFQDTTNLIALSGTVFQFINSTSIVLSVSSTISGTFLFKYGTDNTAAMTNAVNALTLHSGGTLQLQQGSYEFGGAFNLGNAGIYAVINLPATSVASTPTNNNNEYLIEGNAPALRAYSTQSNGPAMSGSILDLLSQPAAGTTNAFFSQMGPLGFVLEQFKFENVDVRQKMNPPAFGVYARWGGSIYFQNDAFDVEFPPGYTASAIPVFMPTNLIVNSTGAAAIWFPTTGNDANIGMDTVLIMGYPAACNATEHWKAGKVELQYDGTGVYVENTDTDGGLSGIGSTLKGAHILLCQQAIQFAPEPYIQPVDFQDIGFEPHGFTNSYIYDPSNTAVGFISFANTSWVGAMPSNLNWLSLITGTAGGPNYQATGIFGSELGSSPINTGIIFDCNFNGVQVGLTGQTSFTDRSPFEAVGNSAGATFTNTPSPDGIGVTTLAATSGISFPAATVSGNYTNFTLMLLVNSMTVTPGTLLYPISRGSGPNNFLIYYNNGTDIGYRITTGNGVVTAHATVNGGAGNGAWHALAMTYNGSTITGYLDGNLVATASQTGAMITPTGSLALGSVANDAVSHVRCWNRVLSPAEIQNYSVQVGNYIPLAWGAVPGVLTSPNGTFTSTGTNATTGLNTNNFALTNLMIPIWTWLGPTNSLGLSNYVNEYNYVQTTNCNITNLVNASGLPVCSAELWISNSTAYPLTNTFTGIARTPPVSLLTSNPIIVAPGGVSDWLFKIRPGCTNFFNAPQ